jgi:hypothetical protein
MFMALEYRNRVIRRDMPALPDSRTFCSKKGGDHSDCHFQPLQEIATFI